MKITFLGTGAANLQKNRDYTATAIEVGDSLYLIDAGASVFAKMTDYGLDAKKLRAVFITHGHFDHVGGLPMLVNVFCWTKTYGSHPPINYFFPEKRSIDTLTDFIGALGEGSSVKGNFDTYGEGEVYLDENIKLIAIPTLHMKKDDGTAASFAFALYAEGKCVVFSGDLSHDIDSEEIFNFLKQEKTDLFVCELAHFSQKRLLAKIKELPIGRVCFNHLPDSEENIRELKTVKNEYSFEISAAYDGERVEV